MMDFEAIVIFPILKLFYNTLSGSYEYSKKCIWTWMTRDLYFISINIQNAKSRFLCTFFVQLTIHYYYMITFINHSTVLSSKLLPASWVPHPHTAHALQKKSHVTLGSALRVNKITFLSYKKIHNNIHMLYLSKWYIKGRCGWEEV